MKESSMKSIVFSMAFLAATVGDDQSAAPQAGSEKVRYRKIIRAGVDKDGKVHGELAQATGLVNATSLGYKVLLKDKDGQWQTVNPANYEFRLGQQFRIELEADTDMYLYVFHEDKSGERSILVPDAHDGDYVPMVRKGAKKVLPDDNTHFEFVSPVGTDKLIVYGSKEKRPDLLPPEDASEKAILELKTRQDQAFEKVRSKKQVKIDPQQVADAGQVDDVLKFTFRDIGSVVLLDEEQGTTVISGSRDPKEKPVAYAEIPLTSKQ
jgi:hypothetical protein